MERTVIAEKQMLSLKFSKGKKTISLEAYELFAKALFESVEKREIFAQLFLVLGWRLTKGEENFVNVKKIIIMFTTTALFLSFQSLRDIKREKRI